MKRIINNITLSGLRILIVSLLAVLLHSCGRDGNNGRHIPVARVLDRYLYLDDLRNIIPAGLSAEDSLTVARDFIDNWVRQQLILNKAEHRIENDYHQNDNRIFDVPDSGCDGRCHH